ncbi:MAG: GxxExxY protein [Candidatus Azobacteroides sp.]|nr:GxxExxY protein [Candidatus Azobacteroides sp.]
MEDLNKKTYDIRKVCFDIHNNLGPGLLESVYEAVLSYKLSQRGYNVKTQVLLPVIYEGIKIGMGFRLDLLIDDEIIIELKSVESLQRVHVKQLLTYLRLADVKLGLLINFNSDSLDRKNFVRLIN